MLATHASADTVEFLRRYYDAIDQQRPEEALACFAPDATVRAGNEPAQPWMQGLQAMARKLRGVVGTNHSLTRVVEGIDGETAFEVEITYALEGGGEVTLPGAVFCEIREDLFHHQSLYIDLSPVHDALGREG
jgi:ketosteroid isomerase-like protein